MQQKIHIIVLSCRINKEKLLRNFHVSLTQNKKIKNK
jgi:hypothetical protein